MTVLEKLAIMLLTVVTGFVVLQAADKLTTPGSFSIVSAAQAIVGRPMTPVSVAGWLGARYGVAPLACTVS